MLGGGGYVAGPMVYAAWRKKIPAALTEADAHLGLANRLAAPFARRVFLAYAISGRDGGRYRVVGRPIRHVPPVARDDARRLFSLPPEGSVLLVFGGSQGARGAERGGAGRVRGVRPRGAPPLRASATTRHCAAGSSRDDYRLLPWTDDFAAALAASDLVLARAGGSVWEVAAAGKPAVLVPSPNVTADHQTKNARYFAAGGGSVVVPESELSRVPALVRSLLDDPARLAEMGAAMLRAARPDAADEIAEELLALA